jgi:hypothetical protein
MKELIKQVLKFVAGEAISKFIGIFSSLLIGAVLIFGIGSTLVVMYKTSEATDIKIEKAKADGCQYLGMIENGTVEFYDCGNKVEMRKGQL